ncbi:tetratricopeptide repeat protein [Cyclobacterium amurskyense]|uniref:TPR repeat protein n=1 Tax=Cyclobacterium amurskyense TaxID=320787 RepID=A0A0H4PKR7_9BACT|nr:tetratricopeptide repeat protein [Cyclobacterium amurskyense]AKP53630.1 TPR repeat protein [Cyclobacterium amurskyense]|tara:strand:- start:1324 stop:2124 length:801 start_codon:yes stop_codon:yes gene_type:complete
MVFRDLRIVLACLLLTSCFGDFKTGEQLYNSGAYDEAVEEFSKVLFASTTDLKTLHLRARSYEELGKYKEAMADYKKIITLDPKYAYAYAGIAKIAWDRGDFKEAENNLLYAAMIVPEDYDVILFLSRAMIKNERYKSAIEFLDLAIKLRPREPNPHYYKGIAMGLLGDGLGVVVTFNKYIELEPNNVSAIFNRGLALMTLGYKSWAVEDFDTVLEMNPNHYEALARRAVCLMEKNPRQSCFDLETAALKGNEFAKLHQNDCNYSR